MHHLPKARSLALAITPSFAPKVEAGLDAAGLSTVVRIAEQRATDLAIAVSAKRLAVIRCVDYAHPDDHTALATMICEGDFVWAGLVYGEREGSEAVGLVETFHVSELDQLVSRLLQLREVFSETG